MLEHMSASIVIARKLLAIIHYMRPMQAVNYFVLI